jgi:hypothetical protein
MRLYLSAFIAGFIAFGWAPAIAAPTLTFFAQIRTSDPSLVDMVVRVQGIVPDGLAAVHVDLGFDASAVSLVTATAGDFFTSNSAGGSLWTDTASLGLVEGDQVLSTVTDATTGPDTLGFDFLEVFGFASYTDGVLLNLVFDIGSAVSVQFRSNDVLLIDGLGSPTFQVGELIDAESPGTVPEPGAMALTMLALTALAVARRTAKVAEGS